MSHQLNNISVGTQVVALVEIRGPNEGSLDHVIPRSRGGKDAWENLVWSAKEVNQKKADRLPQEAGLRLLSTPPAPKELSVSAFIRNIAEVEDWKLFFLE